MFYLLFVYISGNQVNMKSIVFLIEIVQIFITQLLTQNDSFYAGNAETKTESGKALFGQVMSLLDM